MERSQQSLNEIAMKLSYHWSSEEKNLRWVGLLALVVWSDWISLNVTYIFKCAQFIYNKMGPKTTPYMIFRGGGSDMNLPPPLLPIAVSETPSQIGSTF